MPRALITAVPFGEVDRSSLNLLDAAGVSFDFNPLGRRLKAEELVSLVLTPSSLVLEEELAQATMNRAHKDRGRLHRAKDIITRL